MIRLIQESKNTPEHFNENFIDRSHRTLDSQDKRRWKKLVRYYRGGSILDIGCLDSQVLIMAKSKYPDAELWGIDQSEQAIDELKKKYPDIQYHIRDAYDTKFSHDQFDYVVLGEVIEHLEDPQKAIQEAMRVLKPKGVLAISTPLEEAIEPGSVDKEHHIWSFNRDDIYKMTKEFGDIKKFKILGSEWFPYKYHFPTMIAFITKR